jgi:hypothetical protein
MAQNANAGEVRPRSERQSDMARSNKPPVWRRGFFVRLAATGNATLAAKRAGVARAWVYRWRREDARFAAEWQEALDRFARRMLKRAPTAAPGASKMRRPAVRRRETSTREGPLIARRTRGGRPQLAMARESDWNEDKEADFFAMLGATLNVSAASRAAGFTSKTAWARRRADPTFARRWEAVIDDGAHRLELRLMELAARDIGALADDDAAASDALAEARAPDPDLAKWLLKFRRDGGKQQPRRGWRQQEPDIEEVRQEILRKVAAMERAGKAPGAAPGDGQEPYPMPGVDPSSSST